MNNSNNKNSVIISGTSNNVVNGNGTSSNLKSKLSNSNSNNKNTVIVDGENACIHVSDLSIIKSGNELVITNKNGKIVIEGIDKDENGQVLINGKLIDLWKNN